MASAKQRPDFNLANGGEYMLRRSYAAASRLNFQYYLWKDSLRFNIHPSIPVPKKCQIADVATGTCIWLAEVARDFPDAQLDGFDIDLSQAPPTQWLPSNVTLKTCNIFDPPPEEMTGAYDIVHVRLLVLVVQKSDPRKIIQNLLRMLKPGGYLQWDDLNYPDTHVRTCDDTVPAPALQELRRMVYSEGRNDWTLRLPNFFAEEGLIDSKLYHFEDSPHLARANGEQHLLTMEEFSSSLARTNRTEEAAKISNVIQEVSREVLKGAVLSMPRVVCVGRKPSGNVAGISKDLRVTDPTSPWYKAEIGPRMTARIRSVYEVWARIPGNELISHIHQIRKKAWPHGEYPCIGQFMFLLPSISAFPQYSQILERAKTGETILDIGCCFGQDLRLLATDGVSPLNMYASDISSQLWDLGFDLFNDRDRMGAQFLQADIFDPESGLAVLHDKVDIIIANQFLHLFDWDGQVTALEKIVKLSKPGSILIGYQRAQVPPKAIERPWGKMFFHDTETYREMWRRVEATTGTKWNVDVRLVDLSEWGMEPEDVEWMPEGRRGINFVVTRKC